MRIILAFIAALIATTYSMPAIQPVASAVTATTKAALGATGKSSSLWKGIKAFGASPLTHAALAGGAVAAIPLSAGLGTALRDSRRQRDRYRIEGDKKQQVINLQENIINRQEAAVATSKPQSSSSGSSSAGSSTYISRYPSVAPAVPRR